MKVCKVEDCETKSRCLGYCQTHYSRFRKYGHPNLINEWVGLTPEARFWKHVTKAGPDECWEWSGATFSTGYGEFCTYANGVRTRYLAHRYIFILTDTLIEGSVVLHLCDNPPCVNPAHLRQGTQKENIRDAMSKGRLDMSGLIIGQKMSTVPRGGADAYQRRKMRKGTAT